MELATCNPERNLAVRIFVSWAGNVSQHVAGVLHKYLPCILQNVEVFVSKHDIESGDRWGLRLAQELESSDFGILCLTAENLRSDWLLFEAGALTKKLESRACGLLIGSCGLATSLAHWPSFNIDHSRILR